MGELGELTIGRMAKRLEEIEYKLEALGYRIDELDARQDRFFAALEVQIEANKKIYDCLEEINNRFKEIENGTSSSTSDNESIGRTTKTEWK